MSPSAIRPPFFDNSTSRPRPRRRPVAIGCSPADSWPPPWQRRRLRPDRGLLSPKMLRHDKSRLASCHRHVSAAQVPSPTCFHGRKKVSGKKSPAFFPRDSLRRLEISWLRHARPRKKVPACFRSAVISAWKKVVCRPGQPSGGPVSRHGSPPADGGSSRLSCPAPTPVASATASIFHGFPQFCPCPLPRACLKYGSLAADRDLTPRSQRRRSRGPPR
jgi:hypothetical protein